MLASIVLLVAVVALVTSNTFWRWMYPIQYQIVIQNAATTNGVDPLLVAAVIRVESKFDTHDVSQAGAIGLMQLMPGTAQWIALRLAESGAFVAGFPQGAHNSQLTVPTVNIQLGTWYVRYLIEKFDGNRVAAIAAYNAGPKRVQQWLQSDTWNGQLNSIDRIPVGETRHFVDRVFYNYDLYQRIYGNSLKT
ncbi:lytic transglycosylase domain-containing protein [Alicyclobacillaceae bacterium I2511]|nr:lytic transglycosylase domain-containing protein [Alicyclobacillaceae bacterium I2511]